MGLTVKNKNSFELSDNLTDFFSLPLEEEANQNDYESLKDIIYSLDIDNEEKVNILNNLNLLKSSKSIKEKNKIKKEIESFKEKYNI